MVLSAEWGGAGHYRYREIPIDNLKPLEVIERGETDRIWRIIYDLEAGEAF